MKKLIVTGILTLNAAAYAAPAEVYDKKTFWNETSSIVLRDNEDSSRLNVLPPSIGRIVKEESELYVSKTQCEGLAEVETDQNETRRQIKKIKDQRTNIELAIAGDKQLSEVEKDQLIERYNKLGEYLKQYKREITESYDKDTTKLGGYLHLEYATPVAENIARIKANNPYWNVIEKIGENMKIQFTVTGLDKEDGTGALIYLDYSVNGIPQKDLKSIGAQSTTSTMKVDFSITAMAACTLKYPNLFDADKAQRKFAMSTTYDIPKSYSLSIKGHYNLLSIYNYLHEQGKNGGLFSSSSYSNTVESNWGKSAVDVDFKSTDPNNTIDQTEQIRLMNDVKSQMGADLASLISQRINYPVMQADAAGANGLSVLADGLSKVPDPDFQMAALGMKALDAMFGSSKSSTQYKKTLDEDVVFDFNSSTVRFVRYTTVY